MCIRICWTLPVITFCSLDVMPTKSDTNETENTPTTNETTKRIKEEGMSRTIKTEGKTEMRVVIMTGRKTFLKKRLGEKPIKSRITNKRVMTTAILTIIYK